MGVVKKLPHFLYNYAMNMDVLYAVTIVSLLPGLLTLIFVLLNEKTSFNKLNEKVKQIIYGVVFGIIAVIGTEYGIPFNGAQVNARDAAVLTGGLLFGAPAGIIAGLIGGIERYFSNVGDYTRIACTVSTIIAGIYSAGLRKYMFDDKRPSWSLAFVTGMVIEVFHMTMVFLTNMSDVQHAMDIVKTCSIIMVPANSLSVMFAAIIYSFVSKNKIHSKGSLSVAQNIQRWLLVSVSLAFIVTTLFSYNMQTSISDEQVKSQLLLAIKDIANDIEDASDNNLLKLTYEINNEINKNKNLNEIKDNYGVAEISVIDSKGIIIKCTNSEYIDFDMSEGEQSKEFLCLLSDTNEYVQKYGPITIDKNVYRKYAGVKNGDGFIQVGYGAEEFQKDIANQVKLAANNKHVGETGYVIIADKDLNIVSATNGHYHEKIVDYGFDPDQAANEIFTAKVDGEECYCTYTEAEGYYLISVIPSDDAYRARNVALWVNTFMETLVFALMFGLIYILIKKIIVEKLNEVNNSLDKITDGDLNEVVNVNSNFEFISLSKNINQTVDRLKQYIAEANARIDSELEYAKNIQESALPHVFPESRRYEIYALMDAAKEVGGDFYDVIRTSRNTVSFLIADVSGKGIPGAMFMMRAKSELHSLTETGIQMNDVFTFGNDSLCQGNETGMFVTAWEGSLDLQTGLVKYANAGHNPPVLMHTDGTCEFIRGKAGFVLAGMEGIKYKMQELQMKENEILFLYTDGVVEATNANKELFGEERLIKCLNNMDRTVDMEYLCCEVIGEIGRFVGDNEQFDDITMLAIKYKGSNEA